MCIRDRDITYILTASVRFPSDFPGMQPEMVKYAIPEFLQLSLIHISEPTRPY